MRRPNPPKVSLLAAALALALATVLAACTQGGDADPFEMTVLPQQLNGHAIGGQQCVFLVTVDEDPAADGDAVLLTADATKATVTVLEANRPELGITGDTEWTGTMVSPQWLVVSHYLFFSEEWELHLEWHIMVAPDDWARIDLRHRFDESQPSYAFEISSVTGSVDPVPMAVPETVWR